MSNLNNKEENYINFNAEFQSQYGNSYYCLDLSFPYSLVSDLVGYEFTEQVAKRFMFVDTLYLGEIEGKHSDVEVDLHYNYKETTPKCEVSNEFMYERFMEDFLDCLEIDTNPLETEDAIRDFLSSKYNTPLTSDLLETIRLILANTIDFN